jgi:hypothetical protein
MKNIFVKMFLFLSIFVLIYCEAGFDASNRINPKGYYKLEHITGEGHVYYFDSTDSRTLVFYGTSGTALEFYDLILKETARITNESNYKAHYLGKYLECVNNDVVKQNKKKIEISKRGYTDQQGYLWRGF